MLTPPKAILTQIKNYDRELFIKWNNVVDYFEVWRKMPWGDRLITPVVSNIYDPGHGDDRFCPLDQRIVAWLYSADSQRKDLHRNWRWMLDRRFKKIDASNRQKSRRLFRDIAAEQYNSIHDEIIGLTPEGQDKNDWLSPDVSGISKSRILQRSSKNAKEFFNDNNSDNR